MAIDSQKIRTLREQRAWSQDELATVSGLSHRTIQRIEASGSCSPDSQKAIASAFGVTPAELGIDHAATTESTARRRGMKYGVLGALGGFIAAYAGISHALFTNQMSAGNAGLYYGIVAAFTGVCLALIGVLSNRNKPVNSVL